MPLMPLPVLTAMSDAGWEARLVAAFESEDLGVSVVRRCVDLADLLATVATGQASAVLLSADLRRLDREALARLALAGVAVVGLVAAGDEEAERRLRQLGVQAVLTNDATAGRVSGAVKDAVGSLGAPTPGQAASFGEPRAALTPAAPTTTAGEPHPPPPGTGRVIAVWGPTGAPGRTTLAVGLASEAAALGRTALLVDADVYGGVIAQVLGVLDEAPGLAAAARQANNGSLDLTSLAGLARSLDGTLRVLTGISRPDRWPELRPAAVESVLELARSLTEVTVVDCAFCIEQDEELSYDTAAPRRNGVTLAVLEAADVVVVVGSADPIGLQRLVRALDELRDLFPEVAPVVVVNRLRGSSVPGDAAAEITAAMSRYAGVREVTFVPMDVDGLDAALVAGGTLAESAAGSSARRAIAELTARLVGAGRPASRRLLARH